MGPFRDGWLWRFVAVLLGRTLVFSRFAMAAGCAGGLTGTNGPA